MSFLTWSRDRQGSSFATGIEVQDRRKRVLSISTGSKSVDAVLGGTCLLLPINIIFYFSRLILSSFPWTQVESCLNLSRKVRIYTFVVFAFIYVTFVDY
jgi:hypothetical protein